MGSRSKDPKKKRDRFHKRLALRKGGKTSMPKKWIEFPTPVTFYDPDTREVIKVKETGKNDVMNFGEFLKVLMANPLWNEGYKQGQAQDSILRSYDEASAKNESGMWVAEEDHAFLDTAAKNPRTLLVSQMGPQVLNGFGRVPAMARQYLPFQDAIIRAKTESEKAKDDEAKKVIAAPIPEVRELPAASVQA
jgi:hypothetical protein